MERLDVTTCVRTSAFAPDGKPHGGWFSVRKHTDSRDGRALGVRIFFRTPARSAGELAFALRAEVRGAAGAEGAVGGHEPLQHRRDQLLGRFRDAGNAILLGTDSLWEGVDVPGRALRALVLTKLPFKVPSEPLTAARLERLESQGHNGFTNYLLPHAALKLKQGFGRLIRTERDVGVVLLLDRRIVTKRYGPLVLNGLPNAEQIVGEWNAVLTRCEDFFARFGIGAAV